MKIEKSVLSCWGSVRKGRKEREKERQTAKSFVEQGDIVQEITNRRAKACQKKWGSLKDQRPSKVEKLGMNPFPSSATLRPKKKTRTTYTNLYSAKCKTKWQTHVSPIKAWSNLDCSRNTNSDLDNSGSSYKHFLRTFKKYKVYETRQPASASQIIKSSETSMT